MNDPTTEPGTAHTAASSAGTEAPGGEVWQASTLSVTLCLLAFNLLAFVLQLALGSSWAAPSHDDLVRLGGNLGYLSLTSEPWRLLTNMAMHGGWAHVLTNMALLLLIGPLTQAAFGRSGMALIYLLGGLLASLASAWWGVQNAIHIDTIGREQVMLIVSVGASGAIMALCGAALAAYLMDDRAHIGALHEPGVMKNLVLVVGVNMVQGAFMSGTDQAAHVGGIFAGGLLALVVGLTPYSGLDLRRGLRQAAAASATALMLWGMVPSAKGEAVRQAAETARQMDDISEALRDQARTMPWLGAGR